MSEFTELTIEGRVATPADAGLGRGAPRLEPGRRPAARRGRLRRERRRRRRDGRASPPATGCGSPARAPATAPRAGRPRGHDPDQDRAACAGSRSTPTRARRGSRPVCSPRARRGRPGARALLDAGLLARRRRDRLHARRRPQLAGPQARLRLQQGAGDRAGHRRRRAAHGRRRQRAGPLLGAARRRRRLRDRHRAPGRAAADRRGLRRRPALPGRGRRRGRARLPRLGRRGRPTRSARWSASSPRRRSPTCPSRCAAAAADVDGACIGDQERGRSGLRAAARDRRADHGHLRRGCRPPG